MGKTFLVKLFVPWLLPYFAGLHVRLISHLSNRGKPESRGALPVHYPVSAGLRSGRLHQSLGVAIYVYSAEKQWVQYVKEKFLRAPTSIGVV